MELLAPAPLLGKPPLDVSEFLNTSFFHDSFLILENGQTFSGISPNWQKGSFMGEVVFTTGMTGYEASLTDPSYAGQILVFTFPLIGNYGVPSKSYFESEKIFAKGVVVSNICQNWSHNIGVQSFLEWLNEQNIPLIMEVDTRALTKVIREKGTLKGYILEREVIQEELDLKTETFFGKEVSIKEPMIYGQKGKTIIAVDCGMKTNILRNLQKHPLIIKRVPYNYDYSQEDFDGVFLSNGPGNPEDYKETIAILKKAMLKKKPIFGICLGVQILSLATDAKTYKLPYGHRGHNQPCMDLSTKKCYMTSQNHGYAIKEESLSSDWIVSFKNLNDNTVEGIKHLHYPFSGVQFHPEAAPGPTDTEWLFEKFTASL